MQNSDASSAKTIGGAVSLAYLILGSMPAVTLFLLIPDISGDSSLHLKIFPLWPAAFLSTRLRRERELAFYGDVDFIPTEEYSEEVARRAFDDAKWIAELAKTAIAM